MRTVSLAMAAFALFFGLPFSQANSSQEKKSMNVKRITSVLLVDEIEPVVPFWVDRLGFTKTIEVPGDHKHLAFIAFQKGSAEVMYQTYDSVERDAPAEMSKMARKGPTYLYIEVDDLNAVLRATHDLRKVMPERTAFYGMREFAVQDPQGHFVTFAQPVAALSPKN